MKEESIFHIKVDYDEALQSKKELLSSERDVLRVLKFMKKYSLLRKEELTNRLRLQNKVRDLKTNLTRMNNVFPKIKIPNLLKKKLIPEKEEVKEEKVEEIKIKTKEVIVDEDLEKQLREIQEKLKKLG